ncbi:transcriptional regulator [Sphingomonas sp. MAH-20]|uniref:Transcriptional regulator n=1 Tax=Sphingomonas horti TaxID=2682842 RepID=A0A6I4J2H7_9SPHN|nr:MULTISPECIES: transcriptional regulator [Sphingomonas]MBA2919646.1 transcriptional regulator [Sphingomonas sp. CGMCC 1.13658]MVO78526.1 transcriptional regulator [Sphingomonas horti]
MRVFVDFEASSLSKNSYPIEVAWVFEDGAHETWLIRPAPAWSDWDARAERIHGIPRALLEREGEAHDRVAARMLDALSGHDLLASAPSWDGKWLSALLRAAGLSRHALRLRDSDDAHLETAMALLQGAVEPQKIEQVASSLVAGAEVRPPDQPPAHRALADAQEERLRWFRVREEARLLAERLRG